MSGFSEDLGHKVVYAPCSTDEVGHLLVGAYGDATSLEERKAIAEGVGQFRRHSTSASTWPFAVDLGETVRRRPINSKTLADWARRQTGPTPTRRACLLAER